MSLDTSRVLDAETLSLVTAMARQAVDNYHEPVTQEQHEAMTLRMTELMVKAGVFVSGGGSCGCRYDVPPYRPPRKFTRPHLKVRPDG